MAVYDVPTVALCRLELVIASGGCGVGAGGGTGVPLEPTTVKTNCRSEWLSPPHQDGPPSAASRSCTITHGRVVSALAGVPATRPLDDIDSP